MGPTEFRLKNQVETNLPESRKQEKNSQRKLFQQLPKDAFDQSDAVVVLEEVLKLSETWYRCLSGETMHETCRGVSVDEMVGYCKCLYRTFWAGCRDSEECIRLQMRFWSRWCKLKRSNMFLASFSRTCLDHRCKLTLWDYVGVIWKQVYPCKGCFRRVLGDFESRVCRIKWCWSWWWWLNLCRATIWSCSRVFLAGRLCRSKAHVKVVANCAIGETWQ